MKKKISGFLIGYVLLILVICLFWLWALLTVNEKLVIYEQTQPERVVEQFIESLKSTKDVDGFKMPKLSNQFEKDSVIRDAYIEAIDFENVTYKRTHSVSAETMNYDILSGEKKIVALTLTEVKKEPLLFILSKTIWRIDSIVPVVHEPKEQIVAELSSQYDLYINDKLVDDSYIVEQKTLDNLKYAAEYVEVPNTKVYKVGGLYEQPTVTVKTKDGNVVSEVLVSKSGEHAMEYTATEFMTGQMEPELQDMVLKNAKDYTNFFSKDLPGANASTKPIAHMFPSDSYYLELAENYRREDMWMYSAHATPTFEEESVTNYISYTEDLFSCDVYFKKNMLLTRTQETRQDITHSTFIYGKINGEWKILDILQIIEDEGPEV